MSSHEPSDKVSECCRQAPDSHHLTDELSRSELCHRAEPYRTQREFTERLEEITGREPKHGDTHSHTTGDYAIRSGYHDEKREAGEEQTEREFRWTRGIFPAPSESDPHSSEHRGENNDENRIHGLKPERRH